MPARASIRLTASVIAWCAALIGMLFSLKAHQRIIQGMVTSNIDWGATALGLASVLAFLLLSLAVIAAFWCVKPSLSSSRPSGIVPAVAPAAPLGPAHVEFIWKVHPYTNEYIRFADTKAAAVIAWCAALIGMLFSLKAHQRIMQGMVTSNIDWGATALGLASVLAFLLLSLAVIAAFWCVKPSLWSRDGSNIHDPGYVYWGQVRAHQTPDAFKAGLAQQTPEHLAAHCADNVYVLAGIAKQKYWWVDWSIRLAISGSFLAGVVALFAQ